ncbi:MAG TPA: TatD family hydrolase [Tepidisphaeraceae bacterium]|nr:TatD family hydrolase [Tepidisphaeraceae bacterium]
MIDTHCHLTDERLSSQLDDVLSRAERNGVRKMVSVATNLEDSRASIALCQKLDNVRCSVGIHPNYVAESQEADVAALEPLLSDPAVVAIGEMGMDYFHGSPRDRQRWFFIEQLRIAQRAQRPVIIHCREAVDDTLAIMADFQLLRAVFHCFTGTEAEAKRIADAGYWLGYTGVITFKKSDEQRRAVLATPLERLLVETDAPYLSPEPFRGQKVNEPSLVVHTARRVAELKGLDYAELDAAVTRNAETFYDWR